MRALALPLRRPIGTAAVYAMIVAGAAFALNDMPLALAPDLARPGLLVRFAWAGASPELVVSRLTSRVESELEQLAGVQEVSSVAGRGFTEVAVEYRRGTRMDRAEVFLRERLAALRDELPRAVAPPEVVPLGTSDTDGGRFFVLRLGGPLTAEALRRLAEDRIAPRLAALPGVARARAYGGGDPEIHVDLDPGALDRGLVTAAAGLVALEGVGGEAGLGAVRAGGTRLPAVHLRSPARAAAIGRKPVGGTPTRPVSLDEVASVREGWPLPRRAARVDGSPAVQLVLEREPGTNTLRVAAAVRRTLERLQSELPAGVSCEVLYDQSERIRAELGSLSQRAALSLAAMFAVLLLSLGRWRAPIAVLGAVLFSTLLTFLLFRLLGLGLDLVTLSGLGLAFGMAVDGSIVLLQSIAARAGSRSRLAPIVAAARQVLLPLLAGTATTAVVLVPFLYVTGDLRTYYLPFVLAVCLSLVASFVVTVTLVPLLARWVHSGGQGTRLRIWPRRWPTFRQLYPPVLERALHRPLVPASLAVLLFAGGLWVFETRVSRGSLFPSDPDTGVRVSLALPQGAELERTDHLLRRFERHVLEHPFRSRGFVLQTLAFLADNRGFLDVRFAPEIAVTQVPGSLQDELEAMAATISGAEVSVMGYGPGFSSSRAQTTPSYQLTLRGPSYGELAALAEDLGRRLEREPRVREVDTNAADWTVESEVDLALVPDRERMARFGVTMAGLAAALQPAVAGELADRELRDTAGDVTARVRLGDGQARSREDLLRLRTPTAAAAVPFAEVLRVEDRPVQPEIRRRRQQYERRVTFDYRGPRPVGNRFLRSFLTGTALPPGYTVEDGLGIFLTRSEERDMAFALGLALALVYMVGAALFESFLLPCVAILGLPLGFTAIAAAFWALDEPFDRGAYVGLVLLVGVAINTSLLLVHRAGALRRRGLPPRAAMRRAALERCRPIAMTAATSVAGLLPLALGSSAGTSDAWRALALAACAGLAGSCVTTLGVVPALFVLVTGPELPPRKDRR